ncbi:MAG: protoheme farnesyltransferase [Mycobacterium sp.]|nr:protoheme farnesyltransferase [Mycobacterium sp.]
MTVSPPRAADPRSEAAAPSGGSPASSAPSLPDARGTAAGDGPRLQDRFRAYLALTKPRIIELLLVTTVPPMVLAKHGLPSLWLILATLVGGSLAAGSANTINCYVDRDIDVVMQRTRRRPLASGVVVTPAAALRFGIVLGIVSTLWLGLLVNWPSALLTDAAILVYVFVYSLGLKRRTPSNIVIGGAAGCFPTVIGWSAVTGGIGWPAVVLFAVVFLWTPPHFWALALRFREDYAAAGVPMLPVVASTRTVMRRILGYSYLMVAASLVLIPVGKPGVVYDVAAPLLGVWFLLAAHRLSTVINRSPDEAQPMKLFHLSITYLSLLFAAVAVSPFIG